MISFCISGTQTDDGYCGAAR